MKNIHEIMIEMDTLSCEIASTLNEDESMPAPAEIHEIETSIPLEPVSEDSTLKESDLEEEIKELADLMNEDAIATNIPPCGSPCPTVPNRRVDFCCVTGIPSNLGLTVYDAARMIYSTKCLHCIVEPCNATTTVCGCPTTVTVYKVKIVGCIPFLINTLIRTTECVGTRTDFPRDSSLCCHDSVCVNNVICTKCSETEANTACSIIKAKLINCACTPVTINRVNLVGCGTQVTGFFTLPNCNPPSGTNCNP